MITLREIKKSKKLSHKDTKISKFLVLYEAVRLAKRSRINNGLWLEFGVYKASSINFIAHLASKKRIFGFDSFKGLPERWVRSAPKGTFDRGGKLPEVHGNVRLIKGLFRDTLEKFLNKHPNQSATFIHIDCDIYSSTSFVLETLKDRITPGTVIVFDELFGYRDYRNHEFKALNEFLESTDKRLKVLCHSPFGNVAVMIK